MRTGMIARGLRAVRRMAVGSVSRVYLLTKDATTDTLATLGSTDAAHQVGADEGQLTLVIAEDAVLDETAMARAAAFGLASEADGSWTVYRRIGEAVPPIGPGARVWSFNVAPTGVTFDPNFAFTYTFPFALA